MVELSVSPVAHPGGDRCAGGTAAGLASWLSLAAAPTFVAMAAWCAFGSGPPETLCGGMQVPQPMSGMTAMYLMMSVFHTAPWLRLRSGKA